MIEFRVDKRYVLKRLRLIDSPLRESLSVLIRTASQISRLGYIVLGVTPEFGFKGFPVDVSTYDHDKHEFACPLHCVTLLENVTFLEPQYDYPIGRIDLFDLDLTSDWQIVHDEVVACITDIWQTLQPPSQSTLCVEYPEQLPIQRKGSRSGWHRHIT